MHTADLDLDHNHKQSPGSRPPCNFLKIAILKSVRRVFAKNDEDAKISWGVAENNSDCNCFGHWVILRTDVIACVPSADKTNTWPRNRRALVSLVICTILQIIITWLMVKHVHNCVREVTPVPGGYRSREDIERLL